MLNGIGPTGIILIILVALLLFGPNKLPELGRAFGRTLKEFKAGAKDIMNDDEPTQQQRKEIKAEEVKVQEHQTDKARDNRNLPE